MQLVAGFCGSRLVLRARSQAQMDFHTFLAHHHSPNHKIHLDQLLHGLPLINFRLEGDVAIFGRAKVVTPAAHSSNSVYLQVFPGVRTQWRNGELLVSGVGEGALYAGQSLNAWRRHPAAEGHSLYVQLYCYTEGTAFDRDCAEQAAIAVVFYMKERGWLDRGHVKLNKSPYALNYMFYLTLDGLAGSAADRSIGFSISGLGVVVDNLPASSW